MYFITYDCGDSEFGDAYSEYKIMNNYGKTLLSYNSLKNDEFVSNIKIFKAEEITNDVKQECETCITYDDVNKVSHPDYYDKMTSYNQFLKIADYYNRNRQMENEVYYIIKSGITYDVYTCSYDDYELGTPLFYNEEDARRVIKNPNFKSILENYFK